MYISVAVHSAIHLMSQNASFVSGAPRLMVLSSRGVPCVVAFQVSWYYTWRGTPRNQVSLHYTWRCTSCDPAACKSMLTRKIFQSYTLTFACDTRKLLRVCKVIVELNHNLPNTSLKLEL